MNGMPLTRPGELDRTYESEISVYIEADSSLETTETGVLSTIQNSDIRIEVENSFRRKSKDLKREGINWDDSSKEIKADANSKTLKSIQIEQLLEELRTNPNERNLNNQSGRSSTVPLSMLEVNLNRLDPTNTKFYRLLRIFTKRQFWGITATIISMLFMYLFLLLYSINEVSQEMTNSSYHSYSGIHNLSEPPEIVNKDMKVEVRVTDVDLNRNCISTIVYFFPSRSISSSAGQLKKTLAYNLKYYYGIYNESSVMAPVQATIPLLSGSHYYYPFDKFTAELLVEVLDIEQDSKPLPIEIDVLVSTPSLWFDISRVNPIAKNFPKYLIQNNITSNENSINDTQIPVGTTASRLGEDTSFKVKLTVSRPNFVILFSVFVIILMWSLSLGIASLTLVIGMFTASRPGASYLALGPALLFALPTLRNTQPGVPSIGVLIDILGFFWNMIIVTFASNGIILIWMNRLSVNNL